MGEMVNIPCADGKFPGYLAKPDRDATAAIVVIQEIFGVNPFIKAVADSFAEQGYLALAPDLFWRIEPGIVLDPKSEEEFQKALGLFGQFDVDKAVGDIQSTIDYLRQTGASKVGATGYCLGGLLTYLTAARTDTDASVGYYGVSIDAHLGDSANIKKPLMLHIAEEDGFVPKDAQAKIRDGLAGNSLVEILIYPGRDHGFARFDHPDAYHKEDGELAKERTLAFFRKHLG